MDKLERTFIFEHHGAGIITIELDDYFQTISKFERAITVCVDAKVYASSDLARIYHLLSGIEQQLSGIQLNPNATTAIAYIFSMGLNELEFAEVSELISGIQKLLNIDKIMWGYYIAESSKRDQISVCLTIDALK